jgi:cytochrome b pre-mRNA-processing protein 3
MFDRWFRPRPAKAAGARLYAAAVAQARSPVFYTEMGVADRIDSRFELYVVHVVLLQQRLSAAGGEGAEAAQSLFDTFIKALDDVLRELGVGDLSVAKKMRKLGEALYGRASGYRDLLKAGPDKAGLAALIGRTIFADEASPLATPMADYVARTHAALALQPFKALAAGQVAWPHPEPAAPDAKPTPKAAAKKPATKQPAAKKVVAKKPAAKKAPAKTAPRSKAKSK